MSSIIETHFHGAYFACLGEFLKHEIVEHFNLCTQVTCKVPELF